MNLKPKKKIEVFQKDEAPPPLGGEKKPCLRCCKRKVSRFLDGEGGDPIS
jgi:hypothetical protein